MDLLQTILNTLNDYGILGYLLIFQTVAIFYLSRVIREKEAEIREIEQKLVAGLHSQIEAAKEEQRQYDELVRTLDRTLNLLISAINSTRRE